MSGKDADEQEDGNALDLSGVVSLDENGQPVQEDGQTAEGAAQPAADDAPEDATGSDAGEIEEGDEDGEDEPAPKKLDDWAQKRLERAKKRTEEADERARKAEERVAELEAQRKAEALDPTEFDTWEEYEAAKERLIKGGNPGEGAKEIDGVPERDLAQAQRVVLDSLEEADPDLVTRLKEAKDVPISARMVLDLAETMHPEAVVAALLDDPDLAKRISRMSDTKRVLALDRLDHKRKAGRDEPADPPRRRTTRAPAPIQPVEGQPPTISAEDADFRTFEAALNERLSGKIF